ncbi:SMI1-KNR4 cell-wall [Mucilaginibacter pineti]|uniref:SMI1-KNR4 cell-wall n=1 Tax=Mucilaginibacter pineti TaxID=1391627 RepID=A0A1G7ADC2_9SPHI|nr:SMI1/KNR4 family protein [Mucilaginibacter pineti]SDE11866.1 SMI1-KNR4 cell-wall [Mucilaginibacter pineti]
MELTTNIIAKKCDTVLDELLLFADDIISFGPRITDNRLELFEKLLGFEFPFDFKYIMKKHNGISLMGTGICGLDNELLLGSSLDEMYKFEHFEVYNKMPLEFFPFSPDGFGNHYCFDLSKLSDGTCPVVFWQHDIIYNNDEVEVCYLNLTAWIKEVMIDWTLDDTNYDGTSK